RARPGARNPARSHGRATGPDRSPVLEDGSPRGRPRPGAGRRGTRARSALRIAFGERPAAGELTGSDRTAARPGAPGAPGGPHRADGVAHARTDREIQRPSRLRGRPRPRNPPAAAAPLTRTTIRA